MLSNQRLCQVDSSIHVWWVDVNSPPESCNCRSNICNPHQIQASGKNRHGSFFRGKTSIRRYLLIQLAVSSRWRWALTSPLKHSMRYENYSQRYRIPVYGKIKSTVLSIGYFFLENSFFKNDFKMKVIPKIYLVFFFSL